MLTDSPAPLKLRRVQKNGPIPTSGSRLTLPLPPFLRAGVAGLFVSSGSGTHPDRVLPSWELIFVREGVLDISENGQPFRVSAGEALLLRPGHRHRGLRPYPPDLSFFWIHFEVGAGPEGLDLPQFTRVARPDHLTSLFRRGLDDQASGPPMEPGASLLLALMLCEVGRRGPPGEAGEGEGAPAVLAHRACAVIHRRVGERLSAADLARELRCNPDYLGRVFRQTHGETVTEAIHRAKLRLACRLLLEEHDTVDQVAARCGFESVGHFRRLFKRQEGLTPRAYRRLYARVAINTR